MTIAKAIAKLWVLIGNNNLKLEKTRGFCMIQNVSFDDTSYEMVRIMRAYLKTKQSKGVSFSAVVRTCIAKTFRKGVEKGKWKDIPALAQIAPTLAATEDKDLEDAKCAGEPKLVK